MVEEYYVNEDTLLLVPCGKNRSKIYDITGIYYIKKSVFEIIEDSCQYYGSSYGGRYVGAKKLLEMEYKLPIILDEVQEVIMFPTCSPRQKDCIWICLNNIENYDRFKKNSTIKFVNGFGYELNISFHCLENQILRATLLMSKLKKRKSNPKKMAK